MPISQSHLKCSCTGKVSDFSIRYNKNNNIFSLSAWLQTNFNAREGKTFRMIILQRTNCQLGQKNSWGAL